MKVFCFLSLVIVWLVAILIGAAAFYAAMVDKREVAGNIGIGLILFVFFIAAPVTASAAQSLEQLEKK